jgi:hypothetical protein
LSSRVLATGAGWQSTWPRAALAARRLLFQAPVLVVGLGLSGAFCAAAIQALTLAWPVTNPEGASLAAMLRVRDGEPLYQDFRQSPYLTTAYPPVMYLLSGFVSRALQLDFLSMAALARGVTFSASLVTCGLIFAAARSLGIGRLAALAGAGMLLPLPFLDEWAYATRPDMLSLAFTLLAAVVLLRRPDGVWLAATIAVLAFFTKQTAVAFPAAAAVWLWLDGRRIDALRFTATWLGLVMAGFVLLQVMTGGNYALNVIVAQIQPTNGFDFALRDFARLPEDGWLPAGLAAVAVVVESVRRRRPGLLTWYWLAAMAIAWFTLRGRGSDVNYLIEPAAAACVLAAGTVDAVWRRLERNPRFGLIGAGLVGGLALLWGAQVWPYWRDEGGVRPASRLPIMEIRRAERPLSEEPFAVLLAGRPLVVADAFHLSLLTTSRQFDPSDLARRVRDQEFDLIVLRGSMSRTRSSKQQPLWPEPVRKAMQESYSFTGRVGLYWLYMPDQ